MLDARRYRSAAAHLGELLEREHGVRFREAPPPRHLRRTILAPADGSQDAAVLGAAIGRLLAMPASINVRHIAVPRVSIAARLEHLRRLLRARRVQLRGGRPRRRSRDRRGDPVRAARALQTRRGRLGAAGELRRDRGQRAERRAARAAARCSRRARTGACRDERARDARAGARGRGRGSALAGAHRRGAAVPLRGPAQRRRARRCDRGG